MQTTYELLHNNIISHINEHTHTHADEYLRCRQSNKDHFYSSHVRRHINRRRVWQRIISFARQKKKKIIGHNDGGMRFEYNDVSGTNFFFRTFLFISFAGTNIILYTKCVCARCNLHCSLNNVAINDDRSTNVHLYTKQSYSSWQSG